MKYIITESKLNETIKNYLNSVFPVEDINWTPSIDENGNEMDSAIEFYVGDYLDEEPLFRWYDKGYWDNEMEDLSPTQEFDRKLLKKYKNESPILEFEKSNISRSLNGYFGDAWKEPFKEWFYDNFGFIVKTFHE
jgi:hypothetical protein